MSWWGATGDVYKRQGLDIANVWNVVNSNNGNFVRNLNAQLLAGPKRADSGHIIGADDGCNVAVLAEKLLHTLKTAVHGERIDLNQMLRTRGQAA